VGVICRDDAGLRMIETALGDIRTDAELGEAGAYRSPKVILCERTYLVFGKGIEVTCNASGQQLWVFAASASNQESRSSTLGAMAACSSSWKGLRHGHQKTEGRAV
jgi:hypothetical protein